MFITHPILPSLTLLTLVAWPVLAQESDPAKALKQPGKGPVKVFILAGQSNMEGYGGIKTLDELGDHPTQGQLLKKIKKEDGSFVVHDDVFIYYQRGDKLITAPLTAGQGAHKDSIGPELTFGIVMVYALVGQGLGQAMKEMLERK
jgi:hypothetical protein